MDNVIQVDEPRPIVAEPRWWIGFLAYVGVMCLGIVVIGGGFS